MADPTANLEIRQRKGDLESFPMDKAQQTLYKGQLACNDATGYLVKGADTASYTFKGIVAEKQGTGPLGDGAAADSADGDHEAKLWTDGDFVLPQDGNIAITNEGDTAYVKDSGSVCVTGQSTNKIAVGMIIKYIDANYVVVRINPDKRESVATLTTDLASVANGKGASLIGIEDAAANFTATTVEDALAEIYSDLASNANGLGASLVGTEDASSLFTATDVEACLDEIMAGIKTAQYTIQPCLICMEDGTAITKFADGASGAGIEQNANKSLAIRWNNCANPDEIAFQFVMPQDLDDSADVIVHFLGAPTSTTDSPVLTVQAFFDVAAAAHAADTDCGGSSEEFANTVALEERTLTIANANVPASPSALTLVVNPKDGELGTDDFRMLMPWLEVTRKCLPS